MFWNVQRRYRHIIVYHTLLFFTFEEICHIIFKKIIAIQLLKWFIIQMSLNHNDTNIIGFVATI